MTRSPGAPISSHRTSARSSRAWEYSAAPATRRLRWPCPAEQPNRLPLSVITAWFESRTRAARCAFRCWRRSHHALELLTRSAARDEARNAHAAYFANLIEHIDPRSAESGKRLRLIDLDIDNFRAAMDWFEHNGEDGAALRLATGLYHYWYLRGLLREGRSRLGGPLGRGVRDPALRALRFAPWQASTLCSATASAPRSGHERVLRPG